MLLKRTLFLWLICCSLAANAQNWNKKQCAVVLTYDDALNVHLDKAIPALDSFNLKGTFYLIGSSPAFINRTAEWKKVAANKHELANHSLFHPCTGNLPGRSFVTADYNLATYSVRRMTDELRLTNSILQAVDGKKERTYAYPCGDLTIGGVPYFDPVKNEFVSARGVQGVLVKKDQADLTNVGSFMINGQTGDELIQLVKNAMQTKSMVVFLFHGVGGEHSLNVSLSAYRKLLQFIKANESKIWVPTFLEATKYMKEANAAKKSQ